MSNRRYSEMNPPTTRIRRAVGLLATLAAVLLGLTLAAPANAATTSASPAPQTVTWTSQAGVVYHAQALTAAQIKAEGLTKYVDMNNLSVAAPQLIDKAAGTTTAGTD